jgi:hypothetical protein
MAYSVPTFNLSVGVYTGPWLTKVFRAFVPCNLRMGRGSLVILPTDGNGEAAYGIQPNLLVPAGSDIRDGSCYLEPDLLEVPAGSGRWYVAMNVDDVGKGFENEFRLVTIGKIYQGAGGGTYTGLFWPFPIP